MWHFPIYTGLLGFDLTTSVWCQNGFPSLHPLPKNKGLPCGGTIIISTTTVLV